MSAPVCGVCGRELLTHGGDSPEGGAACWGGRDGRQDGGVGCLRLGYERALAREEELRTLVERMDATFREKGGVSLNTLHDMQLWLRDNPRRSK